METSTYKILNSLVLYKRCDFYFINPGSRRGCVTLTERALAWDEIPTISNYCSL